MVIKIAFQRCDWIFNIISILWTTITEESYPSSRIFRFRELHSSDRKTFLDLDESASIPDKRRYRIQHFWCWQMRSWCSFFDVHDIFSSVILDTDSSTLVLCFFRFFSQLYALEMTKVNQRDKVLLHIFDMHFYSCLSFTFQLQLMSSATFFNFICS